MKHRGLRMFFSLLLAATLLSGCGSTIDDASPFQPSTGVEIPSSDIIDRISSGAVANRGDASSEGDTSGDRSGEILGNEDDVQAYIPSNSPQPLAKENKFFSLSAVPAYAGNAYVAMNGNEPYFDTNSLSSESYEIYAELDVLGRCGVVHACIGQDLMPTEQRGDISQVKPTGWQSVRYDNVDGGYLYNRCHLIGFQLTAENANSRNLITGTRYMNIDGMLLFENMTADYIKETGNHVAYRVTPVFNGNDLVARGVLMEGWSIEDEGDGVCFCVFAYNVQPGIEIDYATGDSRLAGNAGPGTSQETAVPAQTETPSTEQAPTTQVETGQNPVGNTYILNTNTKKFHIPSCSSVKQMKESNKQEFTGSREEVISRGYDPCKRCNP